MHRAWWLMYMLGKDMMEVQGPLNTMQSHRNHHFPVLVREGSLEACTSTFRGDNRTPLPSPQRAYLLFAALGDSPLLGTSVYKQEKHKELTCAVYPLAP